MLYLHQCHSGARSPPTKVQTSGRAHWTTPGGWSASPYFRWFISPNQGDPLPKHKAALERLFHISVVYIALSDAHLHIRPYYPDSTISRPICEVKQGQVWLVLAWGTSWEVQMLYIFYFFIFFLILRSCRCPCPPVSCTYADHTWIHRVIAWIEN